MLISMSGQTRRSETGLDPTKMANQPALRSSDGLIWMITAGLFLLICGVPLVLLTLVEPRASAPMAWITAIVLVALYAALVTARGVVADRKRRLRLMAVLMLAMAGVALIGLFLCAMIEWSAVPGT